MRIVARMFLAALAMTCLTSHPHLSAADVPGSDIHGDPLPLGALQRLGTLRWRPEGTPAFVGFLKEGREVLTISQDGLAQVWAFPEGKVLRQFRVANEPVPGPEQPQRITFSPLGGFLALSADGRILAVNSRTTHVHFWDTLTGKSTGRVAAEGGTARNRMALSPDGKHLATLLSDASVEIHDVATGNRQHHLAAPEDQKLRMQTSYRLAYSSDGKRLIHAGIAGPANGRKASVLVLDPLTGKEIFRRDNLSFTGLYATYSALSPNGSLLAVPMRGTLHLVDLTGKTDPRALPLSTKDLLTNLVFTPDGKTLRAIRPLDGRDPEILIWDVATEEFLPKDGPPSPTTTSRTLGSNLALSPDAKKLAWVEGSTLRFYDLEKKRSFPSLMGHSSAVREIWFQPESGQVFSRGTDHSVHRWESITGKSLGPPLPGAAMSVVSPDGSVRAGGALNGPVQLEDAVTGRAKHPPIPDSTTGSRLFAFSQDSRLLAMMPLSSSQRDPLLQVVDVATGQVRHRFRLPDANPSNTTETALRSLGRRLLFSPGNRYLLASGIPTQIWDLTTQQTLPPLMLGEGEGIRSAAFSPDSRTLALDTVRGRLSLWEVATGRERLILQQGSPLQPIPQQPNAPAAILALRLVASTLSPYQPCALAFSPDGRWLVHGGDDGKAKLWHLPFRRSASLPPGHRGTLLAAAFAPDGQRVVTGSSDTTLLVWNAAPVMASLREQAPPTSNSSRTWEAALAGDDTLAAGAAMAEMVANPAEALALLRKPKTTRPVPDQKRIQQWIAALDNEEFKVRDAAAKSLEQWGLVVQPALRQVLQGNPTTEVRRAVQRLLDQLSHKRLSGEDLKLLREIEILETIGTQDVFPLLEAMVQGAPGTLAAEEARRSLERLKTPSLGKQHKG